MIVFLLPLAFLAGFALVESRDRHGSPSRVAGVVGAPAHAMLRGHATASSPVTPLATVQAYLRARQAPPPQIAQWACAEAESLGRSDVAAAIYYRFLAPLGLSPAPSPSLQSPAPATQESHGDGSSLPSTPSAPAPVTAPSSLISPIKGIEDPAWSAFVARLARAEPSFSSQRRVGRYHQSRTRLAELGFDAESLIGNPWAQDDALAADLVDGFSRARARGLLAAISQPVTLPGAGTDASAAPEITLSGLLGVLSVAGVEGLAGWLGSYEDRQRFPYTTNLFLQTNGMF
jgi:hypothetical protein